MNDHKAKAYRSYALINFFADSDEEFEALLRRAEKLLNGMDEGKVVDAVLDDEVYCENGDEPYTFTDDHWAKR